MTDTIENNPVTLITRQFFYRLQNFIYRLTLRHTACLQTLLTTRNVSCLQDAT